MSKMRSGAVAVAVVLGGCAELASFGGSIPPISVLSLYDGSVRAAVPAGFCIETQVSRPADGFVVMASCDTITGNGQAPAIDGFVTVQVGETGSGLSEQDIGDLVVLLETETGRSLLSQSGTASDVTITQTGTFSNAATVRFVDSAPPPVSGLQPTEWRGFFDVNGRMTTVAVRGLTTSPLSTDAGRNLLRGVIEAVQSANSAPDTAL